jgi:hypothetical protein
VATPVNQAIALWNATGGTVVATPAILCSHRLQSIVIWVQAGGDAEADGWSTFWGSAAQSSLSLVVPSISVHAY